MVDVEAVVDQIGGVRRIVTVDGMAPVPSLSLSRSQSLSRRSRSLIRSMRSLRSPSSLVSQAPEGGR